MHNLDEFTAQGKNGSNCSPETSVKVKAPPGEPKDGKGLGNDHVSAGNPGAQVMCVTCHS